MAAVCGGISSRLASWNRLRVEALTWGHGFARPLCVRQDFSRCTAPAAGAGWRTRPQAQDRHPPDPNGGNPPAPTASIVRRAELARSRLLVEKNYSTI